MNSVCGSFMVIVSCLVMGSELSIVFLVSLDPPLPVYFYTLVSAIRERGTKGYPTKKVSSISTEMY